MLDFLIRQMLRLVVFRSRFYVLIEIRGPAEKAVYASQYRGFTTPLEIQATLKNVESDICGTIEGIEVQKLIEECSK